MIKLTLSTDNEYVEKDDIIRALHANDAYLCISNLQDSLRMVYRYGNFKNKQLSSEESKILESFIEEIQDIFRDLPGKFN